MLLAKVVEARHALPTTLTLSSDPTEPALRRVWPQYNLVPASFDRQSSRRGLDGDPDVFPWHRELASMAGRRPGVPAIGARRHRPVQPALSGPPDERSLFVAAKGLEPPAPPARWVVPARTEGKGPGLELAQYDRDLVRRAIVCHRGVRRSDVLSVGQQSDIPAHRNGSTGTGRRRWTPRRRTRQRNPNRADLFRRHRFRMAARGVTSRRLEEYRPPRTRKLQGASRVLHRCRRWRPARPPRAIDPEAR